MSEGYSTFETTSGPWGLETYDGSSWIPGFFMVRYDGVVNNYSSLGFTVFADGENMRLFNDSSATRTFKYWKFSA